MLIESNTKKLIILGSTILALVLAAVWFFIMNTGILEISAPPPYSASISPKGGERECVEKICTINLPPHAYTVTVSKKGYFSQSKAIEVLRGKTSAVSFDLAFIPTLVEQTAIANPTFSETIKVSNFLDVSPLAPVFSNNFLQSLSEVSDIFFSPNGRYAILTENGKKYSVEVETGKRKKTVFPKYEDLIWSFDGDFLYFLEEGSESGLQRLSQYSRSSGEETVIVYFRRAISKAVLRLSDDEKVMLILDKGAKPESLYLVDIEKKSREHIFDAKNILDANISPSKKYILYQDNGIFVFDREKKTSIVLPFSASFSSVVWTKEDALIVATEQAFVRFWPENGTSESLITFAPSLGGHPKKLFFDRDETGVYFVSSGKIFFLQLTP